MSSGMPPGEDYQTHRTSSDSPESAPPAFVTPVHGRSYAESLTPVVVSAPPKRRRFPHPSPLLVGIASLLILAACFGGWLGGYEYFAIQNQSDAPATALQQFCAAEARQDYEAAFQLMTPAFRQNLARAIGHNRKSSAIRHTASCAVAPAFRATSRTVWGRRTRQWM